MAGLPYLTAKLPGTGGRIRQRPEDFRVTEIPAYEAAGEGSHVLAWIEKRELTTFEAIDRLAAALGVDPGGIGSAGMKDRHAVTRQQLSLPPPCTPEQVLAVQVPGLTVLSAARHPHKLRTGHLRGNRFVLRVCEVEPPADEAAARATTILAALAAPPGSPNWYGEQRFGAAGDNAAAGRALVTGSPLPPGVRPPRGRQKRLLVSAFQSELFNDWLRRRIADGLYRTVLAGDVLQKRDSHGIFVCADPEADGARLVAGELVVTGPMFGPSMRTPAPGSEPAAREEAVLAAAGVRVSDFARVGKLAEGTRRAAAVDLGAVSAAPAGPRDVELCFELPAGAYATAVLREIVEVNKEPC